MLHASPGSDETLLTAWRAGDRVAGQCLFSSYYPVLSRYFRNKAAASVRGDLVQQTFAACVKGADHFRGASSFRTYVLRIAHHVLVDHYRAAQRLAARVPERDPECDREWSVADELAGDDDVVERRESFRVLLGALRRLPLTTQVVIELRFWESLTVREVAEVLGLPEGTVKTRERAGLKQLRKQIDRDEIPRDLLKTTLDTIDAWAARVRGAVACEGPVA
jgi:RNA polymerase sigma-70 factor (ECF subfamily)